VSIRDEFGVSEAERARMREVILATIGQERAETPMARLIAKLDTLIGLMVANERARELSPWWRRQDGMPLTRAECEAAGHPFGGPDTRS